MKSYIQGLITGAILVFSLMVLIGASDKDDGIGRFQISTTNTTDSKTICETILDTKTGKVVSQTRILADKIRKVGW